MMFLKRLRLGQRLESPPRPQRRTRPGLALASFVVLTAVAACVSDRSPTAVRQAPTSFDAARSPGDQAARKAEHDRLLHERDSLRALYKQMREEGQDAFRAAQAAWQAYKKAFEERRKTDRNASVDLLRCQPQPFAGDAEVIGPDGGALKIGPHSLVIPKGALDHEVLLTGVAPTSELIQVQFGPHGLQFQAPAQLTLSYEQCMRPDKFTYRIVYVEDRRVLEFPPSLDDKTLKKVTAPIEHFSGYMIAY